jgi:hypothetical protein
VGTVARSGTQAELQWHQTWSGKATRVSSSNEQTTTVGGPGGRREHDHRRKRATIR